MITLVVFLIALALLIFSVVMKNVELKYGRKIFLASLFEKCDVVIFKVLASLKLWWGHVNFKNTKLIFSWIIASIRKLVISIKRRFDHKQSHFFTKREYDASKNSSSVSFFLKDVSDYKRSLREGNENKVSSK